MRQASANLSSPAHSLLRRRKAAAKNRNRVIYPSFISRRMGQLLKNTERIDRAAMQCSTGEGGRMWPEMSPVFSEKNESDFVKFFVGCARQLLRNANIRSFDDALRRGGAVSQSVQLLMGIIYYAQPCFAHPLFSPNVKVNHFC